MRKAIKNAIRTAILSRKEFFWNGDCIIRSGKSHTICEIWHKNSDNYYHFARFRAHPSNDSFGIEIGWSRINKIPDPDISNPHYFDFFSGAFTIPNYIISLSLIATGNDTLWQPYNFEELLENPNLLSNTITEEEAEEIVIPLLEESIKQFINVGIPYLNRRNPTTRNL